MIYKDVEYRKHIPVFDAFAALHAVFIAGYPQIPAEHCPKPAYPAGGASCRAGSAHQKASPSL